MLRILLAGLIASLVVHGALAQARPNGIAGLQPVGQADRIAANPNYGPVVALEQRLPGWTRAANQIAGRAVNLSAPLRVSVILSRDASAQAALDELVANQQNPNSAFYHQWLTPQQVGQFYGPTANDLAAVNSWLTSQGLKIDSVSPSGMIIHASGTMAVVGNAFRTSFGTFAVGERQRLSATSEPSIPAVLGAVIHSVHGLTETQYEPQSRFSLRKFPTAGKRPQVDLGGGVYAILPDDFAVIYDIASVYSGGDKGAAIGSKAQRIAIIGKSRIVASDISNYESLAGLPSVQPNVVLAGVDPGVATGANVGYASEATLDVDRVIGTAPGAQADLVISADSSTEDGVDIAMAYNIDTLRDPIMTISFGSCEAQNGASETDYLNSQFETAASEGISTFVSADDSGVAGCDTPFAAVTAAETPQVASINVLCSSGYVTCVGGTEFNDAFDPSAYWSSTNANNGYESALSYIPEGAWNESSNVNGGTAVYQVAAGGGGVSAFIAKPSWQTGAGVPGDGFRDVPDVSFTAADHDGYLGCFAAGGGSCVSTSQGTQITVFSGTSAAAPGMAGIAALLNTKLGEAQGNLNPTLYKLAQSTPVAFHDVTLGTSGVTGCAASTPSMCNNSTPGESSLTGGLAGYLVGTGYDQATGLGSLDVANFIAAASGGSIGGSGSTGSFTLLASPTTLSVTPVANTTSTSTWALTGTSESGFVGTVALMCAVSPVTAQPPTCAVSPASLSLTAGASGTATISLTSAGPTSSCLTTAAEGRMGGLGGAALAGLLLLVLPVRRRGMRGVSLVVLLGLGLGLMSGCGGSSSSIACSNAVTAGTTAGTYTVTVTGTSGSLTATAPATLTVTVN
jgi:subtilase family serine protease